MSYIPTLKELLDGSERESPTMSASPHIIEYVKVKALINIAESLEKIAARLDPDYGK